jgi:hypothetical protein
MTLAKFIALLNTRALFFPRLDCLEDDYEGALPRRWRRDQGTSSQAAEEARRRKAFCYVNCWNISDHENEALWRLYGAQDASIAIRSSYGELAEVVRRNDDLHLGLISYVDYGDGKNRLMSDPLAWVMRKRRAFKHEEEVRFVKALGGFFERCAADVPGPEGLEVEIELDRLVRGIYIDPYAPEWFEKVVRAVVVRFAPALSERVTWSSMKADPPP